MTVGLHAVFKASDQISGVALRAQAAVLGFTKSAGKGLAKLDEVNSRIGAGLKTTAMAVGAVGLAGGFAAKHVLDAGADFEQAITNVGAVSLMTREQVADLEKKALELGATTKFSATEVANAMEMMGKAGFTNGEVLQGVGGILAAAAAEGAGLEETASNVSNVLKGMGLATSEAGRVADVLTLASARTNSSISSLGQSMANVSSTARQLGVPLEDTVSMVALLQDVGLDASEAGSAVSTMLTKMSAPTKEVRAQMAALGISFSDAAGNMLPPVQVLEQLQKAAKKSGGNMKQVAFFSDLVGMRGQKAAINLQNLLDKESGFRDLAAELRGAAGSAEKMAAIRMDTLLGDWEQLGGSVDSFKIKLFNMESGPLRGVVKGMSAWVDANGAIIASDIGKFIEQATPVVIGFGNGLKSAFQQLSPAVKEVGKFVGIFGNEALGAEANAYLFAKQVVHCGLAFVAFTGATKVARMAVFAFEIATKSARLIMLAWNAAIGLARSAVLTYEIATKAGVAGTMAMSASSVIATGNLIRQRAAAFAAAGGMRALAGAAGLATVAYLSYQAVTEQNDALKKETGGKGVLDVGWEWMTTDKGLKEIADENLDKQAKEDFKQRQAAKEREAQLAKANNIGMASVNAPSLGNDFGGEAGLTLEQRFAQLEAMKAPPAFTAGAPAGGATTGAPEAVAAQPVLSPDELSALKGVAKQQLELTIKTPEGTTAEVTKRPKGTNVNVAPSGGM